MQTETIGTHSDEQIVEAVRGGETERYRELVERYERRVYAVAWSRLGDPDLAQEATQEAFIRGFRQLRQLNAGGRFAPWISTIARRIAINLGFRHRRELNKRERWALEQRPEGSGPAADESPEFYPPETLRQTLAELPDAHRECLVLFYLEGKSGADAAAALDISETAFRVRLHRARGVLRERLEGNLENSLQNLRPARSIVPAVMAAVLISSSAKAATAGGTVAAGIGAKLLSGLGKSFLFAWLLPFISLVGVLPALVLGSWLGRVERRNYREADGFRARLHRGFYRSFLWGFPLLILLTFALTHGAMDALGIRGMFLCLGLVTLWPTLLLARLLVIQRNPFQIGIFIYCIIIIAGLFIQALGWIPPILSQLPMLLSTLVFMSVLKHRPARMDYSLLLRASRGLLKFTPDEAGRRNRFDRPELLRFARFLGSRWLAMNYRWETSGLALRLAPVKSRFLTNITQSLLPMSSRHSSVSLAWDGTAAAHCDRTDAADLESLEPDKHSDPHDLERRVADAVGQAWREFRIGNSAAAERALGQMPETEVFVVPTARSSGTRWLRWSMGGAILLMVGVMVLGWNREKWRSVSGARLKPVAVSESEIRASLAQLAGPTNVSSGLDRDLDYSTFICEVLPPTNLFTPAAWQKVRDRRDQLPPQTPMPNGAFERLERLMGTPALEGLLLNDWLSADEFVPDRAATLRAIAALNPNARQVWFEMHESEVGSAEGTNQNYTVLDTRSFARKIRCLQKLGCLDAVNAATVVETLLRHQVLSKQLPPRRRQDVDPKLLHGLFLTFGWDPIEDTWQSLVILDALGALDRVDRAACADGILRFHHGQGLFGSVRERDGLVIFGGTRDTLCAFESLRMLKALDRVKDLEEWKFRPMFVSKPATNSATKSVTWSEIEAWVCRERFERMLIERKEHPEAPPRSLLEVGGQRAKDPQVGK